MNSCWDAVDLECLNRESPKMLTILIRYLLYFVRFNDLLIDLYYHNITYFTWKLAFKGLSWLLLEILCLPVHPGTWPRTWTPASVYWTRPLTVHLFRVSRYRRPPIGPTTSSYSSTTNTDLGQGWSSTKWRWPPRPSSLAFQVNNNLFCVICFIHVLKTSMSVTFYPCPIFKNENMSLSLNKSMSTTTTIIHYKFSLHNYNHVVIVKMIYILPDDEVIIQIFWHMIFVKFVPWCVHLAACWFQFESKGIVMLAVHLASWRDSTWTINKTSSLLFIIY